MATSRFCKVCRGWHTLDEPWPEACWSGPSGPRLQIMRDIGPYRSMITGEVITSRSQHRNHLRQHNCIEVGNETMKSAPAPAKTSRREVLHRQLADMSDRQANKILKQLKKDFHA